MGTQAALFEHPIALPDGFEYQTQFLTAAQEAGLLEVIRALPLQEAQYKEWSARRRIVSYGGRYDFSRNTLLPADPVPTFLHDLRERIAAWSTIPARQFNHAMVTEYRAGTQLGWHRDAPNFESVIGVSLGGVGRMRFRPYPPDKARRGATLALDLEPRSIYLLRGPVRWDWQHAISPTRDLRYSITFRTLAATLPGRK
jgi:alkylated DNA repair dioxygenase AlkB